MPLPQHATEPAEQFRVSEKTLLELQYHASQLGFEVSVVSGIYYVSSKFQYQTFSSRESLEAFLSQQRNRAFRRFIKHL